MIYIKIEKIYLYYAYQFLLCDQMFEYLKTLINNSGSKPICSDLSEILINFLIIACNSFINFVAIFTIPDRHETRRIRMMCKYINEMIAVPHAILNTIQNTIITSVNCSIAIWDAIITFINAMRECVSLNIMIMTIATIVITGIFLNDTLFVSAIKKVYKITLFIIKILWKCIYFVFVLIRLFIFYTIKWSRMIIPISSFILAIGSLYMWWWVYVYIMSWVSMILKV